MPTMRDAYLRQKGSAKFRSIDFLLSFDEWTDCWNKSGHADERGRNLGQYVMARYGDIGPYALDNVFITQCSVNCSDGKTGRSPLRGRKLPQSHKDAISAGGMGRIVTAETRAKISAAKRKVRRWS